MCVACDDGLGGPWCSCCVESDLVLGLVHFALGLFLLILLQGSSSICRFRLVVGAVAAVAVAVGAAVVGSCIVCCLRVRNSRCFFDGLCELFDSVFDICHAILQT